METDVNAETQNIDDRLYADIAKKWIIQVIIIGVVAGAVNGIIVINQFGLAPVFAVLVNLVAIVIASLLLFRHVDTLILKRLMQMQGENQNTNNPES